MLYEGIYYQNVTLLLLKHHRYITKTSLDYYQKITPLLLKRHLIITKTSPSYYQNVTLAITKTSQPNIL
jgi:hypothetical protein